MMKKRSLRPLAAVLAATLLLAGCAGGGAAPPESPASAVRATISSTDFCRKVTETRPVFTCAIDIPLSRYRGFLVE